MKLFYCYGPPLIRGKKEGWRGKGEAWEEGRKEGREKRMGGREELAGQRHWETKKFVRFLPGKFAPLPQGMNSPCYPDVNRFVYEEFKVDAVKKVEKRRNAKRVV
jgi:hypothetical protein